MHSIKSNADHLAILGKTIDHEDLVDDILRGLNYWDYKIVILIVNARDTTISFTDILEKLITHGLTLKQTPKLLPLPYLILPFKSIINPNLIPSLLTPLVYYLLHPSLPIPNHPNIF